MIIGSEPSSSAEQIGLAFAETRSGAFFASVLQQIGGISLEDFCFIDWKSHRAMGNKAATHNIIDTMINTTNRFYVTLGEEPFRELQVHLRCVDWEWQQSFVKSIGKVYDMSISGAEKSIALFPLPHPGVVPYSGARLLAREWFTSAVSLMISCLNKFVQG